MENKKLVIAVDGYSSSGKSTLAKDFAAKVGYVFVDTGAMYRAVTLSALRNNLFDAKNNIELEKLEKLVEEIDIHFKYSKEEGRSITYIGDELVESEIRNIEVSDRVSYIAAVPFVRRKLVDMQRNMSKESGLIMDGRDIGTVVFPKADIKLFVTADVMVRAQRRYRELTNKGENVSLQEIVDNVKKRDHLDETREESPLRKAKDAIVLDTGKYTPEEQLDWLMKLVDEKTQSAK